MRRKFFVFLSDSSINVPGLEHKLDLAMVPVISDQLLFDIVNKERTYEQIDVHLFVKKSLDLLSAKNALEVGRS